jgi:uncharacterized protein YjbJ (UPF0337 family)
MSEQSKTTQSVNEQSGASTFIALKDQFLGATKEVIGAVFNENLQNAGAQQRIQGEKEFQELREASPTKETTWSAPWSASDEAPKTWSDPASFDPKPASTEPSSTWFGSWFGSSQPSETTSSAPKSDSSEPSRMTALKDQYVGATKEVAGAVFNENLQNAGAEQRIRGEKDMENLSQDPTSQSNWSAPWPVLNEAPKTWSDLPAEPSKISAVKDQLVGATKEVLGAVFSENLHSAGAEQRIHGEREYEIAIMAQEKQANWDNAAGTVKETAGQLMDNKKMQAEGWAQQREGEIKKVLNA